MLNTQHVCTLYEGEYHLGVAGLINSLVANDYKGHVWVGYKKILPYWLDLSKIKLTDAGIKYISITADTNIYFIELHTDYHLTNYKPHFLIDVINILNNDYHSIYYFDCDIVVRRNWEFYNRWSKYGVMACQEILCGYFPINHPLRLIWAEYATKWGYKITREVEQYFNAGFAGFRKDFSHSIFLWKELMECMKNEGVDLTRFSNKNRQYEFYTDQDMMNLMIMLTSDPISTIGPEGMSFTNGGSVMAHAVGRKPWKINYLYHALAGRKIRISDIEYWNYASGIIKPYSSFFIKYKKIEIGIGKLIAKFIK
jgi:hypothetical protein